jgi:zinc protease
LVVVGDVELEKLKPLVLRYYGALKSAGINTAKQDRKTFAKEPFTQGNISIKRRDALAKATQIMQYYPAPNIANAQKPEELYSLQVLAALLGGGSSSRIYQNLVEQQKIAVAVSADYDPLSYGPSIFALGAIPRHGIEPEKLHQALNQEIQKICRMAPTENEVTHVQQTLVSNVLFAQEDLTALGTVYGRSAIIGVGPDYVENWTTNIEKTDAQSIQKSACSLISAAYSLSGTLLPEEKSSVGEIK